MESNVVSHYVLLEKLGEGGMGVVYKAKDTNLGRLVALKLLPEDKASDAEARARFQREAQAVAALHHENICTIYEVGESEGRKFIAMEYLEGQTLKNLINGKPLQYNQLLDLSIQIAEALKEAHSHDIIHRDIKPANVFVVDGKRAKVLDFGLAKFLNRFRETLAGGGLAGEGKWASGQLNLGTLTERGVVMGTVEYMSPEQARAEQLDARTDLFSFGAVLYEMATGRQAFLGASASSILTAILRDQPTRPSHVNAALPADIDHIIIRALDKERDLRYQHADDLLAELKRLKRDADSGRVEWGPQVYETPRFTESRRELYMLGKQIIMNAQRRLYVVQRTPSLFLGSREYLDPPDQKIVYEKEFLEALVGWIDSARSDRARQLVYLFSPDSTRKELGPLRKASPTFSAEVAERIAKYKDIERASGRRLQFVAVKSQFSGPLIVGDNRFAIWILDTDRAVCLWQENDQLARDLARILDSCIGGSMTSTQILGELGLSS